MKNAIQKAQSILLNTNCKFILLLVFSAFCNTVFADKPKHDLSAENLIAAYENNAVSAEKKYKGNNIRITGKITNIDNTFKRGIITGAIKKDGEPYVLLDDGVMVTFKDSKKMDWENLNKGQKISVVGKCKGREFTSIKIEKAVLE